MSLTREQFTQFQLASQHGIDTKYLTPDLSGDQMREKRLAMESGYDPDMFTTDISAEKMHSIRTFLDLGVEVDMQFIHSYTEDQLKEIQLGEKYGLDTKVYQYPYLDASQMRSMRLKLLSEKVIQYIKYQAVSVLHKIEDKLVPTKGNTFVSNDEKLRAAVASVLKEMNLTDDATIEDVTKSLEKKIDLSDSIDPEQEIVEEQSEKSQVYSNSAEEKVEVIDSYTFMNNKTFALLKLADADFAIVNNLKIENDTVKYDESEHFKSPVIACKEYQDLVINAQTTERKLDDPNTFANLNEAEYVVLAMSDMYTDEMRLSFIQEQPDQLRQSIVELIATTEENPEIKKAAQMIIDTRAGISKEHEEQAKNDLKIASSEETPSHVLHSIAEKSTDENVLKAILKNPNCSNSTMYFLKDNSNVEEAAKDAIKERLNNTKWETTEIDRALIVKDFPSHQIDKNKQPIMLTLIKLPDKNSIGLGATMVIPQNSIKEIPDKPDKVSVSINPARNFTIKSEKGETILAGKSVIKELNSESGKSLDDRLKKAKTKKSETKKEKTKETTKAKTKSKAKTKNESDVAK